LKFSDFFKMASIGTIILSLIKDSYFVCTPHFGVLLFDSSRKNEVDFKYRIDICNNSKNFETVDYLNLSVVG